METVTKRKVIEAALTDAGKRLSEVIPFVMFGTGAMLAIFLIVCPTPVWHTSPALMYGSLNLSVILMVGSLIMESITSILARLDRLSPGGESTTR